MVTIARVSTPSNGLVFQSDKVKLKIGSKIIDTGNLYVSVNSLAWQPANVSQDGISISWREISVQGISNEPHKCIYFMLDHKLTWRGVYDETEANGHNEEPIEAAMEQEQQAADEGVESDDEDEGNISDEYNDNPEMTECWLLPEDLNIVDLIYRSMNDCQALHPDPTDSPDDLMDNDDEDEFYDAEDAFDADGRMQNLNLN